MHSIRHWRLQATRYRLSELRPPNPLTHQETKERTRENTGLSEGNIREWFAKPMPLSN